MNQTLTDLPRFQQARHQPGKRAAWMLAVAMHVLLAIFLIYGIRWQTTMPESVSVDLVSYAPSAVQQGKPTEPIPQKAQIEEPPPAKAEILRKAPDKPKTIVEKMDAIGKMLQRETDRMVNSRITDAANREQAKIGAGQAASARNRGLREYQAKIIGKIRGNIVLPPTINGNPESVFVVAQLPSGEVLSVKLKTSSGNAALDAAVERAILKSSPLPKPDDPSMFERELSIKYRPLED